MTKVAIMQPTYLPWSGYFGLMQTVDVFILLDSVQFDKRSWQQRNQIKTPQGPQWLTVPVITKGLREQLIVDVEIDKNSDFVTKHCRSITQNYSNTHFFKEYSSELFLLLNQQKIHLVDLNTTIINHFKKLLGLKVSLLRSSELETRGKKADLLAFLCQQVKAKSYVSPQGSREYLSKSTAFQQIDIPVKYYQLNEFKYPQKFDGFLPYMSFIDLLFNCGCEVSKKLIKENSEIVN